MATQPGTFGDAPAAALPAATTFNFGDAMTLTFSTLKARFWHMFGLFMCTIPLVIVLIVGIFAGLGAMTQATAGANPSDSLAALGGIGMAMLIGYVLYFLADAWLRSSLLASALSHQAGTPTSFVESLGRGLKHTPVVFLISLGAFFVYMMCYMVGYIIIIVGAAGGAAMDSGATAAILAVIGVILMFAGAVPAFYLWCRWYVNTAARVAEGTGIFTSFHRSRDLTMDHKWTVAGHWLVILAVFMLIYFVIYAIILVIFASSFASLMQASANPSTDPQAILDIYGNMFAGVGIVGGIIGGILYLLIIFLFVAIPACSYAACYTLLKRAKEGDVRVAEVFA
jgi:hypothetical protein